MGQRAIIVVDLQNDYFASGKLPLVGIDAAAAKALRVIEAARSSGDPVIHIRHEFAIPNAPFFVAGSEGAQIHPSVQPKQGEQVILKNYANSFRDTSLKSLLDKQGIDSVVIVGAMSHMCIDATARAAADFGYNATVVHDACATRDLEFGGQHVAAAEVHASFMAALGQAYAALVTTDELLSK